MTRVLMVDNYDSFTYNIVQYFGELGAEVEVFRNDEITLEGIAARVPDRLVISPMVSFFTRRPVTMAAVMTGESSPPMIMRMRCSISSWKISRCSMVRCSASWGVMGVMEVPLFLIAACACYISHSSIFRIEIVYRQALTALIFDPGSS